MANSLEIALSYRDDGFNVIPVGRDKRPLVKWETFQKEFPQIDLIYEWFEKWPNAGIGIITGAVSGCCVVDVDVKDGKPGMEEIAKLLPGGYTVHATTPSGGCHLYFKNRNGTGNRVEFRPGLDFRGEGGYVVAPASPGYKPVAVLNRAGLVPIPDSIFSALHGNVGTNYAIKIDSIPYSVNTIYSSNNASGVPILGKNDQTIEGRSLDAISGKTDVVMSSSPCRQAVPSVANCRHVVPVFVKGRRDDDLFHLANLLVRGGAPIESVLNFAYFCGKHCDPPLSDKDIWTKIESALKRCDRRESNLAQEVREFILSSNGVFMSSDVSKCLQVSSREAQKNVSKVLSRLVKDGVIERHGDKNGCFRKVNYDAPEIDIFAATPKYLDIKYPLGLDELFRTMQKNLVVVAGTQNAGKTAFLLRFCAMNMNRGFEIRYLSSEMGQQELRSRLDKFTDVRLEDWKSVNFREVSSGFQDYILPDGINIIDYLEVTDKFWLVGEEMRKIYDKLKTGIAIIAMQKDAKSDFGRGGSFSNEKPRLYLTLTSNPPNGGIAKIMKAKNWADPTNNPERKQCEFKVRNGCDVRQISIWRHVEGQ